MKKGQKRQDGRRRRTSRKKKGSGAAANSAGVLSRSCCSPQAQRSGWCLRLTGRRTETFVEIAPGSGTLRIGQQLETAGVVRSRYAFDLMRWLKRGTLRAGEYRFAQPATGERSLCAHCARRCVHQDRTVPEGANIFDIAARLQQAGLGTRAGVYGCGSKPDRTDSRSRSRSNEP